MAAERETSRVWRGTIDAMNKTMNSHYQRGYDDARAVAGLNADNPESLRRWADGGSADGINELPATPGGPELRCTRCGIEWADYHGLDDCRPPADQEGQR